MSVNMPEATPRAVPWCIDTTNMQCITFLVRIWWAQCHTVAHAHDNPDIEKS